VGGVVVAGSEAWNRVSMISLVHSRPIALFASHSRRGLGTRNEGLWEQMTFDLLRFFGWLVEVKAILNGNQNVHPDWWRIYDQPCFKKKDMEMDMNGC